MSGNSKKNEAKQGITLKTLFPHIVNSPVKFPCLPGRWSPNVVQKTGHNYSLCSQSSLQKVMLIASALI